MKDLNIVLELSKCDKNELVLKIMKDIFSLGNKVKVCCDNKTLIYSSSAKEYELLIKLIMYIYIFEKTTVLECYCIEYFCENLYGDSKIIFTLDFRNETFMVAEEFYKECLHIISSKLAGENLYQKIANIVNSNLKKDKKIILDNILKFDFFSSEYIKTLKIPEDESVFPYSDYRLTMFSYYPEEIKKSFIELQNKNWKYENYIKVKYCNTLIKVIMCGL